jgi:GT2 family glycosyltransferase
MPGKPWFRRPTIAEKVAFKRGFNANSEGSDWREANLSHREYQEVSHDRLERALQELRKEQCRLERLREDHRVLARSRFYAIRMLWLSAKAMFGGAFARSAFVTATTAGLPPAPPADDAQDRVSAEEVLPLWRSKVSRNSREPVIASIVIPIYNHLNDTLRCLRSLALTWPRTLNAEVIIVDDASTDESTDVLAVIPGIKYLRNAENLGFVRSCNAGAGVATGKYICFLNNDTVVRNAWLDHLVSTAERDARIGAVGAKLIYPNGTLQEAGGIVWRDGTGWNYGRHGDPNDSRYNFERDVDYCSGAALLVRRDAFTTAGGFSELFAPAYYEDTDLCFALRASGLRVVYQPRAEIVHYEGVTSGTNLSAGVKKYQALNRPKFVSKWEAQLREHFESDPQRVPAAARRLGFMRRVLIIDSYVPLHDKESGSNRLIQIVRILRRSGFEVTFLPDNYAALQPYTDQLQELGVEVLYHSERGRSIEEALSESLPLVTYAWICRPELYEKYAAVVRRYPHIKIIYDTVDLHFIRKQREFDVSGYGADEAEKYERIELAAAKNAEAAIVVSDVESAILRQRGISNVHVIPNIHDAATTGARSYERSSGILFIGNYNHTPNVDAAEWLIRDIMPLVWKRIPRVAVTLLGSDPTKQVRALASSRVRVTGYVENVEPFFLNARVFAAPLRFGAGLKGKVGQAMAYGLPMVLSNVAAEGFALQNDRDCIIADNALDVASGIIRLYEDPVLWSRISQSAILTLEPFSTSVTEHRISVLFDSLHGTGANARL